MKLGIVISVIGFKSKKQEYIIYLNFPHQKVC